MTKNAAIQQLAAELGEVLDLADSTRLIVLSGDAGASVNLSVGWVNQDAPLDRVGPVAFLFVKSEDLSPHHRERARRCFARIGRWLQPAGSLERPWWFLNLQGDAGIAAEAAVRLFRDIYEPLENDYDISVRRVVEGRPTLLLPDDGRPGRPPAGSVAR